MQNLWAKIIKSKQINTRQSHVEARFHETKPASTNEGYFEIMTQSQIFHGSQNKPEYYKFTTEQNTGRWA